MDVQLRETFVELPTQPQLSPSENPAIFGGGPAAFPYPARRGACGEPAAAQWRAVEMENEYLKLVLLPDMGGRVAELYDKLAGRDVFLPLRRAYEAGGLAFHFPLAPSPAAAEPVNCLTRRYSDGSASVVIGGVEKRTNLIWNVELRLYPELAYLEQSVELLNPTDEYKPFLWRNAASVPVTRGMRMVCPFDWRRVPEGGVEKWPMDGFLDSSDPAALPDGYETSGRLAFGECFGAYYPDWDFGAAHCARHVGAGNVGFSVESRECAGLFCEPCARRGNMPPHGRLSWREYWFGVRGIGPFRQASRDAAVGVDRYPGGAVVKFSSNGRYDNATVLFTHDGQGQECRVSLSPESPTALEFPGVGAAEKLTVDVLCQGRLLVSLGREPEPCGEPPEFSDEDETEEPVYLDGEEYSFGGEEPEGREALMRLGRRRMAQRKFCEAQDCFAQALAGGGSKGEALFLLASAANGCGDAERALRLYRMFGPDDAFFVAALLEEAALNLRLGNPFGNARLLEGCGNPWGRFLLAVSARAMGLAREGEEDCGELEEFFLAERYLSIGDSAFSSFMGNREDQLVRIALQYARLGLNEDCLKLLSLVEAPGMKTALARAYCGALPVSEALSMTVGGVFVNEPELLELLEGCGDETGRAAWLLGCFQYSLGLCDEAREDWLAAYEQGLRHSALLYCLGREHYLQGDFDEAYRYLREDASLHQSANAESLSLLCRVLRERGDIFERLELLPLLQEAEDGHVTAEEIAAALKDGGLPEEAMEALQAAARRGGAGEGAAGLWSAAAGALALKHAREGRAEEAREAASILFDCPEGLARPARQGGRAEYLHTLGQVYRLTGDLEKSREAFRQGALEGGVPSIREDCDAMRWVRLCQDELRY